MFFPISFYGFSHKISWEKTFGAQFPPNVPLSLALYVCVENSWKHEYHQNPSRIFKSTTLQYCHTIWFFFFWWYLFVTGFFHIRIKLTMKKPKYYIIKCQTKNFLTNSMVNYCFSGYRCILPDFVPAKFLFSNNYGYKFIFTFIF